MNRSNLCWNQYIGVKTFHHWVVVKDVTTNEIWTSGDINEMAKVAEKNWKHGKSSMANYVIHGQNSSCF